VNLIDKGQKTLYFQTLPRSSWQYPRSGSMAEDMTELSDAHQRVWCWDFCVTKLGPEHWAINLGGRGYTYEPPPPMGPFCIMLSSASFHFIPRLLGLHLHLFLPSCLGVRKFSFLLGLPFGCIVIENKFGHCNNGDWKNLVIELAVINVFDYHSWGDRKVLVIKIMTIETFWLTFSSRSKFFHCHLCDNRIV
jgi:hypothetical protein